MVERLVNAIVPKNGEQAGCFTSAPERAVGWALSMLQIARPPTAFPDPGRQY